MKNNRKFFTLVAALILASALLLTGCIYAITSGPDKGTDYDLDAIGSISDNSNPNLMTDDAPMSQAEIKAKMDLHTFTEEDFRIRFFSAEQAKHQTEKRKNGEMFSLTHDEIVYLINDSINKYFSNEKIILTNATSFGIIPKEEQQRSPDHVITCYHSNYHEFLVGGGVLVKEANEAYAAMMADIGTIILYRIAMLDSTFVPVRLYEENNNLWLTVEDSKPVSRDGTKTDVKTDPVYWLYVKAQTGTNGMTKEEYINYILAEKDFVFYGYYQSIASGMDYGSLTIPEKDFLTAGRFLIQIKGKQSNTDIILFPTKEITDLNPDIDALQNEEKTRNHFEYITSKHYHQYNCYTPTPQYPKNTYLFGEKGDGAGALRVGMSYKELVDTFGIPFGFETHPREAIYYTSDGEKVIFYLSGDDYSVTEIRGMPFFTPDKTTQSLISGEYDAKKTYSYQITVPGKQKVETVEEQYWRHLPYVTDELIDAAEKTLIAATIEKGDEPTFDYFLEEKDGYLCLGTYIFLKIENNGTTTYQTLKALERISTQSLPEDNAKGWVK